MLYAPGGRCGRSLRTSSRLDGLSCVVRVRPLRPSAVKNGKLAKKSRGMRSQYSPTVTEFFAVEADDDLVVTDLRSSQRPWCVRSRQERRGHRPSVHLRCCRRTVSVSLLRGRRSLAGIDKVTTNPRKRISLTKAQLRTELGAKLLSLLRIDSHPADGNLVAQEIDSLRTWLDCTVQMSIYRPPSTYAKSKPRHCRRGDHARGVSRGLSAVEACCLRKYGDMQPPHDAKSKALNVPPKRRTAIDSRTRTRET